MSYSVTGAQFPRFLYQYSVPPTLLLLHSTGVLHYHWLHVNPVYGSLRWRLRQETQIENP